MPESNWNDSMTRFLLSLPGGYSAIRFSFQAGDTFYVKLAPCWHGWLSLQSNQSMEAVDFRDGICNHWSMVPLPSLHMSHMPAVEFWKISLKRGTLARLPGPSCNIWSKRPSRRNCSSRHIKRPKSLTSSASATRKCPNMSKWFWILNDSADSVQVHCARLTKDLKVNMQISWVSLQDSRATFSFLPTASS